MKVMSLLSITFWWIEAYFTAMDIYESLLNVDARLCYDVKIWCSMDTQ